MAKTIICSVGTSAAKALGVKPADLTNWVNQQKSVQDAAEKMFLTFRDILPEGESLKNKLSKEPHAKSVGVQRLSKDYPTFPPRLV
ncbi:MAG: hypothetical protein KME60_30145 [Cyanomargarita calcarea GSE-NOS-MK-12-04C]|jgi:hypothetical protein|uniref:Uncharacterized protein n=1 Tax=Cyanomargarita calcarea GSE-NOS-MK-12-04C TaxID=2839659 RepID=A0A951QSC7_9CYAN|nr:hypothetical protein [Cyanomargarita calcarea GSE-NOS-MK-12-04C]